MIPIPQEWIKEYVETLIAGAEKFEGRMRDALLLRADHAMDLVTAFRVSQSKPEARHD